MGCGTSKADLSTHTSSILSLYHLTSNHINKSYSLFLKIHAKVNRTKTPLQLQIAGNRLVIHPHELRAVFAIPHGILSDHLTDVVGEGEGAGEGEELSFPDFLELVTVISLLSREQLLSLGYHSFAVTEADELSIVSAHQTYSPIYPSYQPPTFAVLLPHVVPLSPSLCPQSDFVLGLSELKSLYPGIVNGADIPVSKLGLTAQTTVDALHTKDPSASTSLTLSTFNQVMINQPFFIHILQSIQSSIQRKTRSEREWQHHRTLLTAHPDVLSSLDAKVKRRKEGKKAAAKPTRHQRKASAAHSRAMEKIGQRQSAQEEHLSTFREEGEEEGGGAEGGKTLTSQSQHSEDSQEDGSHSGRAEVRIKGIMKNSPTRNKERHMSGSAVSSPREEAEKEREGSPVSARTKRVHERSNSMGFGGDTMGSPGRGSPGSSRGHRRLQSHSHVQPSSRHPLSKTADLSHPSQSSPTLIRASTSLDSTFQPEHYGSLSMTAPVPSHQVEASERRVVVEGASPRASPLHAQRSATMMMGAKRTVQRERGAVRRDGEGGEEKGSHSLSLPGEHMRTPSALLTSGSPISPHSARRSVPGGGLKEPIGASETSVDSNAGWARSKRGSGRVHPS